VNRVELVEWLARMPREATVGEVLTIIDLHWHDACNVCGGIIVNFGGEHGFEGRSPWIHHQDGIRRCVRPGRKNATPGGEYNGDAYKDCHVCQLATSPRPADQDGRPRSTAGLA